MKVSANTSTLARVLIRILHTAVTGRDGMDPHSA